MLAAPALLLLPCGRPRAQERPRIALVITNQGYAQLGALSNTHRDGDLMVQALRAARFDLPDERIVRDVDKAKFEAACRDYVARLIDAGPQAVGVFYYSGHGAADGENGQNYAIPVDEPIRWAADLPTHGVELRWIVRNLASTGADMNFVFFDACREVLLARPYKGLKPESISRTPGAENIYLAYATGANRVAADDGLFSQVLSTEIKKKPGEFHVLLWWNVTSIVAARTNKEQVPWADDSCPGKKFFFQPPAQTRNGDAARTEQTNRDSKATWIVLAGGGRRRLYFSRQTALPPCSASCPPEPSWRPKSSSATPACPGIGTGSRTSSAKRPMCLFTIA